MKIHTARYMYWIKKNVPVLLLCLGVVCSGCAFEKTENASDIFLPQTASSGIREDTDEQILESLGFSIDPDLVSAALHISDLPDYAGVQMIEVHDDKPDLECGDLSVPAFEYYGDLDDQGRCSLAMASIGPETLPETRRGDISFVIPAGFVQNSYDFVDNYFVYNRAHLIAFCLSGEDANPNNLMTGTRSFNLAMVPLENQVLDYVRTTGHHVLYRSTPVFTGDNLVADGLLLEARSLEDGGKGISFCRYIYNVEPGVEIDYATGENWLAQEDTPAWTTQTDSSGFQSEDLQSAPYIANTRTGVFHLAGCKSITQMKDKNKRGYKDKEEAQSDGFTPCHICQP